MSSQEWAFQLFVVDQAADHSQRAVADLRRVFDQFLSDAYQLEVIDLRDRPELAAKEQLIVIPAVIRKVPKPEKRLTGSFSDQARVVAAFGLASITPTPSAEGRSSDG